MNNLSYESIDNLRKVAGTLPSERPVKRTRIVPIGHALDITIEDHSKNPYKAMFVAATSTWGNNEFEPKWPNTSVEGKLEVIKAVLTHNTLPQAKEMVNFVFRVKGVPRWLFDYHTQVPFVAFMSIGCRDNNKIDSDVVMTPTHAAADWDHDSNVFTRLKDLYERALGENQASWQGARTFLPQSYLHAYHFSQNLLSIVGTRGFHASGKFGDTQEEEALKYFYKEVVMRVHELFPLIGYYARIMFNEKNYTKQLIFDSIRNMTVNDLSAQDLKFFTDNE